MATVEALTNGLLKIYSHVNREVENLHLMVSNLLTGGDNIVKDVQCYEHFGRIALKNHAFSFSFST